VLRSEDHQLSGLMPRTAVPGYARAASGYTFPSASLTSRVPSLSTIERVSLADHRQTVFIGEWSGRGGSPLIK
jgi:hypothetical protein